MPTSAPRTEIPVDELGQHSTGENPDDANQTIGSSVSPSCAGLPQELLHSSSPVATANQRDHVSSSNAKDVTIFGAGPIRLLSGNTSSTLLIQRKPRIIRKQKAASHRTTAGCLTSRASTAGMLAEASGSRAGGKETGTRVALAPSLLLAAHARDPRQWVLALDKPKEFEAEEADEGGTKAGSVRSRAASPFCLREGSPDAFMTMDSLPLSERITLRNLRTIMQAFSSSVDLVALLGEVRAARAAASPPPVSQFSRSRCGTETPGPVTIADMPPDGSENGREASNSDFIELLSSVVPNKLYSVNESTAVGGDGVDVNTASEAGTHLRLGTVHSNRMASALNFGATRSCATRPRFNVSEAEDDLELSWQDRFFSKSTAPSSVKEFTDWVNREDQNRSAHMRAVEYTRCLSQDDFTRLMCTVVPSATETEALELMNKVDYEAVGAITWNELATFLISQTRHRTFMAQANSLYMTLPDPPGVNPTCAHQLVTCYVVQPRKKLVLTGGMEGTVRAWNITTLEYRGLAFSIHGWIIGLHYSHNARLLFIVTMDREVFVLDGGSFEVLRLYRGRALNESARSMVYAHDTTRVVKVGGVVPASEKKAILLAKQRDKRLAAAATAALQRQGSPGGAVPEPLPPKGAGKAYTSLRTESAPLTGCGCGPYVERPVEEGVLTGLVDAVSCSAYHFTVLEEEVLLLGTAGGDVYMFAFNIRSGKKVLVPHRVLSLHRKRVNKVEFLFSMDALLSCSDDGTVKLTSMVNGQNLRVFSSDGPSQHASVRDFAVHPQLKIMVTVGPERQGLVWDFSQENPVTALTAHNAPCRCCAINLRYNQLITIGADGVVHVFDPNRFHLLQAVEPGSAYRTQMVAVTDDQKSLLCFGTYPFKFRVKGQAADSAAMSKYTGHMTTMLTSLYTRTFDHLVTVDAEAMVMTWSRARGHNVFAFTLRDFSDSATMNTARLTCATLDGPQRRLLSGFHNGAVVAWNVVNGQAINFITAGMADEVFAAAPHGPRDVASAGLGQANARPWRAALAQAHPHGRPAHDEGNGGTTEKEADGPPGSHAWGSHGSGETGANSGGGGGSALEVTAVGSVVRHDATFYLFAIGCYLYTAKEDTGTFTVASASKWRIPERYGEVLAISQVNGQVVVCGTAAGVLFYYHVLSEQQEGAALYVTEAAISDSSLNGTFMSGPRRTNESTSMMVTTSGGLGSALSPSHPRASRKRSTSTGPAGAPTAHRVTSRITKLIPFQQVRPHLLMSVHVDGTVALWQTFRRVYLGSVSLTAAGVQEARDGGSGSIAVDVNYANDTLVFADEGGNVHVCSLLFRPLHGGDEELVALSLPNPALYSLSHDAVMPPSKGSVCDAISPTERSGACMPRASKGGPPYKEEERLLHVFQSFQRTHVFPTDLGTIASILIVDPPAPTVGEGDDTALEAVPPDPTDVRPAIAAAATRREPVIVCTGSENYTRIFTLHGNPIGELGMNTWDLGDPSSYRFMGAECEPRAPQTSESALPATLPFREDTLAAFDYLAEVYHAQLMAQASPLSVVRKSRVKSVRRVSAGGSIAPPHPNNGSPSISAAGTAATVAATPKAVNKVPPRAPPLTEGSGTTQAKDGPTAPHLPPVPLAVPLRSLIAVPPPIDQDMHQQLGIAAGSTVVPANISTLMRRSTRQRYVESRRYCGVVKPNFVEHVRQLAAVQLSHDVESHGLVDHDIEHSSNDAPGAVTATESGFISLEPSMDDLPLESTPSGQLSEAPSTRTTGASSWRDAVSGTLKHSPRRAPRRTSLAVTVTSRPNTGNIDALGHDGSPCCGGVTPPTLTGAVDGESPTTIIGTSPRSIITSNTPVERSLAYGGASRGRTPVSTVLQPPVQQPTLGQLAPDSPAPPSSPFPPFRGFARSPPPSVAMSPTVRLASTSEMVTERCGDIRLSNSKLRLLRKSRDTLPATTGNTTSVGIASPQQLPLSPPKRCAASFVSPIRQKGRSALLQSITVASRTSAVAPGAAAASVDDVTDTKELLRMHMDQRKQHILQNSTSRKTVEGFPWESAAQKTNHAATTTGAGRGGGGNAGLSEDLGELTPMSAYVNEVLAKTRKQQSSGSAGVTGGARSFMAALSANMYVAPVNEIDAPLGSRSREDAKAWRDHLKRLQKSGGDERGGGALLQRGGK